MLHYNCILTSVFILSSLTSDGETSVIGPVSRSLFLQLGSPLQHAQHLVCGSKSTHFLQVAVDILLLTMSDIMPSLTPSAQDLKCLAYWFLHSFFPASVDVVEYPPLFHFSAMVFRMSWPDTHVIMVSAHARRT